jgi:hypothetical protein
MKKNKKEKVKEDNIFKIDQEVNRIESTIRSVENIYKTINSTIYVQDDFAVDLKNFSTFSLSKGIC